MNSAIYLDIETIPTQAPHLQQYLSAAMKDELAQALECVKAPSNYKDEAKIADYIEKARTDLQAEFAGKLQSAIEKTSFDGAFGQVVCIGYDLHDDGAPGSICGLDEASVLHQFATLLNDNFPRGDIAGITIVGHNVSAFDLRFLLNRYIVHGIRPHSLLVRAAQAKPWESDKVYDTMVQWNPERDKRTSLDKLCIALGLEGKTGSGADVWPMVQAGKLAEVAAYCENDVAITRAVHRRMTFAA